ncbi:MAG: invasion associated locus B family protein [marine bacterium B5-7]|nr:MAG: invasion associated locus B family protein [marine bacterium B5-7]
MSKAITYVLLCLTLVLPLSVWSQQTDSTGSGANTTEDSKETVETDRFKDWALRCRTNSESGLKSCTLFQRLVVNDSKQVALNTSIGFLRAEDTGNVVPVAVFTIPLGVYLLDGATLQVDKTEPVKLDIERCYPRGCQAGLVLTDEFVARFKAGSNAVMTIKQSRDEPVELAISLSGFSAGYKALIEATPIE